MTLQETGFYDGRPVGECSACMAAVLLYRAPIREFVSAVMSTETEQISVRIDRLSAAGTDRMFRRSASKRPVAGVE